MFNYHEVHQNERHEEEEDDEKYVYIYFKQSKVGFNEVIHKFYFTQGHNKCVQHGSANASKHFLEMEMNVILAYKTIIT